MCRLHVKLPRTTIRGGQWPRCCRSHRISLYRARGYAGTLARKSVAVQEKRVDDQAFYQLFLLDPNGVKIELNFDVDEVNKVGPELLSENLKIARQISM